MHAVADQGRRAGDGGAQQQRIVRIDFHASQVLGEGRVGHFIGEDGLAQHVDAIHARQRGRAPHQRRAGRYQQQVAQVAVVHLGQFVDVFATGSQAVQQAFEAGGGAAGGRRALGDQHGFPGGPFDGLGQLAFQHAVDDALVRQRLAHGFQRDGLAALGGMQGQQHRHARGVQFHFEAAIDDHADRARDGFLGIAALLDKGQDRLAVQRLGGPALRDSGGGQRVPGGQVGVERAGFGGRVGERDVAAVIVGRRAARKKGIRRPVSRGGARRRRVACRQDLGCGVQR
ncbi:hypothetical protein D9M68_646240 [compost metagenome]